MMDRFKATVAGSFGTGTLATSTAYSVCLKAIYSAGLSPDQVTKTRLGNVLELPDDSLHHEPGPNFDAFPLPEGFAECTDAKSLIKLFIKWLKPVWSAY